MALEILIVDDEADIRNIIADLLEDEGYTTRQASDGPNAVEAITKRRPSLVLLDIWLGDSRFDGMKVLDLLRRDHPGVPVVMMSGHGNIQTAVKAIKNGAYDFVEKPFKADRLCLIIKRALETAHLREENTSLKSMVEDSSALVGTSPFISQLQTTISKVAPANSRVMITGPSGSGKELIAREIHEQSPRNGQGQFFVLNCASMDEATFDTELFGKESKNVEKESQNTGILERAHLGTLLLDEITDMPLSIQGKLARVLQENAFTRIGGEQKVEIDVRVIATSSKDLKQAIEQGILREDLFYRLNVVPIPVKPLKDRKEDIPVLAEHFLKNACQQAGVSLRKMTDDTLAALQAYDWSGNIRQLKNVIDWTLIMSSDEEIGVDMLPPEVVSNLPVTPQLDSSQEILKLPLREARELFEKQYLISQVSRFSGNISQTAQFIGMERSALHRKLRALGVVRGASSSGSSTPGAAA
ncbi:MAG: sigma-54-dependent transcriptional regulator [Alphaproteobacteria bacterium]